MRRLIKAIASRVAREFTGDSVRLFEWFYYIPLLTFGIYATFWQPINIVEPVMGYTGASIWSGGQIVATTMTLIGLGLRHGGSAASEMTDALLLRDWTGLMLQATGHLWMHFVLWAFEIAAWSMYGGPYWWLVSFPAYAISAYVIGTAVLCAQCLVKLRRGEQLRQALE